MAETKIEWADRVWNPITGCTKISPACDHCYAERMSRRLAGRCGYPADEPFRVTLHADKLTEPRRWRERSRVFVCSMGDLFHEDVPDEWVYEVWRTIATCSHHTFLWLTKRPDRMQQWFRKLADTGPLDAPPVMRRHGEQSYAASFGATPEQADAVCASGRAKMFDAMLDRWGTPPPGCAYPVYDWMEGDRYWPTELYNLWLGVTVEDQEQADKRIPILLDTPAAKRFVSCEPLLGPVDLAAHLGPYTVCEKHGQLCPDGQVPQRDGRILCRYCQREAETFNPLDWVIAGGETGPGARPMHPSWARSLRDQCQAAGVPFFFKQWGEWAPAIEPESGDPTCPVCGCTDEAACPGGCYWVGDEYLVDRCSRCAGVKAFQWPEGCFSYRVGKKAAGHLLDGEECHEIPRVMS